MAPSLALGIGIATIAVTAAVFFVEDPPAPEFQAPASTAGRKEIASQPLAPAPSVARALAADDRPWTGARVLDLTRTTVAEGGPQALALDDDQWSLLLDELDLSVEFDAFAELLEQGIDFDPPAELDDDAGDEWIEQRIEELLDELWSQPFARQTFVEYQQAEALLWVAFDGDPYEHALHPNANRQLWCRCAVHGGVPAWEDDDTARVLAWSATRTTNFYGLIPLAMRAR